MKVINAKGYVEFKLIINYNPQYTCWGLVQKVSSKMYVFVTVTLHMLISERRIQWTFVIANMTSNKFSATSKNFHSPIILGHVNSYNIPSYIEHRFLWIPRYIDQKNLKNRSFYQIYLLNSVSITKFEGCFFRTFESHIKFQSRNLNS